MYVECSGTLEMSFHESERAGIKGSKYRSDLDRLDRPPVLWENFLSRFIVPEKTNRSTLEAGAKRNQ